MEKFTTQNLPFSEWLSTPDIKTWAEEHDSCAIVASVRKNGLATHGNVKRALAALSIMGHRSGEVNGEGDGCGILTDIPRRIWAQALEQAGKPGWLAEDRRFFVGHLMIPNTEEDIPAVQRGIFKLLAEMNLDILIERPILTRSQALGKMARNQAPLLWQVAGLVRSGPLENVERTLFDLLIQIENNFKIHVASLSSYVVVYKVRGAIEALYQYFPELRNTDFMSAITIGHARYSTNTATSFERVQPFSLLGHNGEINTISRLREQASMVGVELVQGGSDSQDVDRVLSSLIHHGNFSLAEAMEIVFPPILTEVEKLPPDLQTIYKYYRQAFGPFSQGPAGIISRYGDDCVFSVDALGLRPLWFGDTEKEFFFSSEKGVYHLDTMRLDPVPLSPGEKMMLRVRRGQDVEVLNYASMQQQLQKQTLRRFGSLTNLNRRITTHRPLFSGVAKNLPSFQDGFDTNPISRPITPIQVTDFDQQLSAFGWGREDKEWIEYLGSNANEPLGSLGHDGPLSPFVTDRQNIADYFKEAVAVVTNPAVDREREIEHFSTQVVIGCRPALTASDIENGVHVTLDIPLLLDHFEQHPYLPEKLYQQCAAKTGCLTLPELEEHFPGKKLFRLQMVTQFGETTEKSLERIAKAALGAVQGGSNLIILDDSDAFQDRLGWIDPLLALSVVDRILRSSFEIKPIPGDGDSPLISRHAEYANKYYPSLIKTSYRRKTGIIVRSRAIRHLHDIVLMLGFGADAVVPYLLYEAALNDLSRSRTQEEQMNRLANTVKALRSGIEKCTSTMGIHELRGYGRLFASIGLSTGLAKALSVLNFGGSEDSGLSWNNLDQDALERKAIFCGDSRATLSRVSHLYPKIWKKCAQLGKGEISWQAYENHVEEISKNNPIAIRHILDFNKHLTNPPVDPASVDIGITSHNLPFIIASMSFGSQGEIAFRSYAEAAFRLNMISMNGEGGEIPDMMGRYPYNRGIQIASGRFGITAELINASNLLEIKVGQGAKPGEGGHLPARKVTAKVAAARHAQQGIDLISPSNNHDIYSIEDLAQFIEELKTTNPKARVAVKVPVVPGIGIIAVGIAKADADIIYLSGYDGGTGAARQHSLRYVGLPVDIGVVEAHRALSESGLRRKVEIWADGGVKTSADVVKLICLGANRVGFGTMAMVAIGCTICRDCQSGTCHTGITTQLETTEQAYEYGIKHFAPRDFEEATKSLVNLFEGLGEGVRQITADLGFTRLQDLVGRSDLLEQGSHFDKINLAELIRPTIQSQTPPVNTAPLPHATNDNIIVDRGPLRRPRNSLTTVISNLVMETFTADNQEIINFEDDKVTPVDRALGTHLTGALTRFKHNWDWMPGHGGTGGRQETWRQPLQGIERRITPIASLRFFSSSVPGNGLGAYNADPVQIIVEGGAQDGVAKGISGGRVIILKGYNHDGKTIDGSVGKSLAYGGVGGLVIVQGNADSRACIRLSGADVIIGGEIAQPLNDSLGFLGARANVKGFLCEYMTAGRVLVLGDPGPWICSGMTGGVLYLRLQPYLNFDEFAIQKRLAKGAKVDIRKTSEKDLHNLRFLVNTYAEELSKNHQLDEAQKAQDLLVDWNNVFVKVVPAGLSEDQRFATE